MTKIDEAFNYANGGNEFYTRMRDVEKELSHYNFSNMIVYCNCDNPTRSNFYKYFKTNFKKLGLRKLLITYISQIPILLEFDGINERKTPIGSGRFQDNEDIIKMCDIVVTNPPFSNGMVISLMDLIIGMGKKFIIVGPISIITRKKVFDYVKSGFVRIGHTSINSFEREDGTISNSATCWWTNMNVDKPILSTNAYYNEEMYPKYDNCDAIDCGESKLIPMDYNGVMGVPIRFITIYNPKQFKLVGILNHPRINGKNIMSRLLIQKIGGLRESIKTIIISENSYNRIFKQKKNR